MNWKFWEKKKEEVEVPHGSPRLILEVNGDSNILIGCSWPSPDNGEEAASIVNNYAHMLFLLATGKLLPIIKQTVGGVNADRVSAEMGRAIVISLNNALKAHGYIESDEPMIGAQEAFAVRGPRP